MWNLRAMAGGPQHCAGGCQILNWLSFLSPPFSYQYDDEGDSEDEGEEGSEDEEVGMDYRMCPC